MTQQVHNTVFISYRRSTSSYLARAIYMDLKQHGYDVFMDVQSIDAGQFDEIILRQIEARAFPAAMHARHL
ncbi:MAG: toll/interleukin-1 receptor domain-containing protein [Chloroflexi bacterium]|nr:toll/interleukin-1 receptor domain-containing protein [Chloroflexota bacterium]